MPIEQNQVKIMKSLIVSDSGSNGGRMSEVEVASGVKNNLWPDVPGSERTNGSTKFRKVFVKIASPDSLKLIDARIFVETPTPNQDRVVLFITANGQTDTQADVASLVPLFYGAGQLNADVSPGATTLTVNVEDQSDQIFNPNQLVRITNKASVEDPLGTEEFFRIKDDASGVSWNGNLATLTLATGTTLANAYQTISTRIASVIEAGDLWARTDNWALSSSTGTVAGWNGSGTAPDTLTGSRMVDAIAGIEQTWTITFTNATTFACVGDTVGSVGGGTIASAFAPTHGTWSKPYFTLPVLLWGGTWAAGNVLTFRTHPAAFPVWEKRITPPNTGSLSGNKVIIGISGESE
ncbi:MAG: hypothetical protein HQL74_15815 [Magnetococcales bacterium]|nr:hypothetical protein [Magnetococcales bacterium]